MDSDDDVRVHKIVATHRKKADLSRSNANLSCGRSACVKYKSSRCRFVFSKGSFIWSIRSWYGVAYVKSLLISIRVCISAIVIIPRVFIYIKDSCDCQVGVW